MSSYSTVKVDEEGIYIEGGAGKYRPVPTTEAAYMCPYLKAFKFSINNSRFVKGSKVSIVEGYQGDFAMHGTRIMQVWKSRIRPKELWFFEEKPFVPPRNNTTFRDFLEDIHLRITPVIRPDSNNPETAVLYGEEHTLEYALTETATFLMKCCNAVAYSTAESEGQKERIERLRTALRDYDDVRGQSAESGRKETGGGLEDSGDGH